VRLLAREVRGCDLDLRAAPHTARCARIELDHPRNCYRNSLEESSNRADKETSELIESDSYEG
jgi:hypothetical protein